MTFCKTTDNVNIYYELNGEGKPIIFIHGFADSQDSFRIQKKPYQRNIK